MVAFHHSIVGLCAGGLSGNFDHRRAGALIGILRVGTMTFRFDSDATVAIIVGAGQNSSARIACHRKSPDDKLFSRNLFHWEMRNGSSHRERVFSEAGCTLHVNE